MKTYSHDLRIRVVDAYDAGDSTIEEIAERFSVSRSWVYRLIQRRRESGSIAPRTDRCGRHAAFRGDDLRALGEFVEKNIDATLAEIQQHFSGTVDCSQVAIHNTLKRLDLRFKKNAETGGARPGRRRRHPRNLEGKAT